MPSGINARTVAAWLYNRIDMTNSAIPNSHGICRTIPSMERVSCAILPWRKVSPIHAIPKIAITACIPAGNTEPCVALIPSVLVTIRMIAAADNITISIMEDIPSVTISPSIRKLGRIPSKEPKRTIKAVANIKMSTESMAERLFLTSLISIFLSLKRPSFKRF